MDIRLLESADPDCDAFVRGIPEATLCHTSAWADMVMRSAGHRACCLVACDGERLRGVLSLNHVRSRLFGNRLIAGAFGNYGWPLGEDRGVVDALYQYSLDVAIKRKCDTIEFRCIDPLPYDLQPRADKVTFRLDLEPDPDAVWQSFKSETKVRNHIRKAEKAGVVTVNGGLELLDEFYGLYAIRMHELGTPAYSRRLMHDILATFPGESRLFVARLDGRTAAVRLVVCFNGLAESWWGVTRVEMNRASPNHALYWEAIRYYCRAGATCFDFGRSTVDTGPFAFKKQWGGRQITLHYQYWVRPGHVLSVASPDNPKYARRIEMWKKLPHWLTRIIGPPISRGLP